MDEVLYSSTNTVIVKPNTTTRNVNPEGHYWCKMCYVIFSSLPRKSRCGVQLFSLTKYRCGSCCGRVSWYCSVCDVYVSANGKTAHRKTNMHNERHTISSMRPVASTSIEIGPSILIEEIYPDHGPHTGGTFITIRGTALDENCIIMWDNVIQKTYVHTKNGTIHCFSPERQHGWISTITIVSIMNAHSNAVFFKYDHILLDYPFIPGQYVFTPVT